MWAQQSAIWFIFTSHIMCLFAGYEYYRSSLRTKVLRRHLWRRCRSSQRSSSRSRRWSTVCRRSLSRWVAAVHSSHLHTRLSTSTYPTSNTCHCVFYVFVKVETAYEASILFKPNWFWEIISNACWSRDAAAAKLRVSQWHSIGAASHFVSGPCRCQ